MRKKLIFMVELRHYEAANGWECSSGLLESVQRTANNQMKEPSAKDKYRGTHRHYFKIKVCPVPLVEWTSVNGSIVLLMQTASAVQGTVMLVTSQDDPPGFL